MYIYEYVQLSKICKLDKRKNNLQRDQPSRSTCFSTPPLPISITGTIVVIWQGCNVDRNNKIQHRVALCHFFEEVRSRRLWIEKRPNGDSQVLKQMCYTWPSGLNWSVWRTPANHSNGQRNQLTHKFACLDCQMVFTNKLWKIYFYFVRFIQS